MSIIHSAIKLDKAFWAVVRNGEYAVQAYADRGSAMAAARDVASDNPDNAYTIARMTIKTFEPYEVKI